MSATAAAAASGAAAAASAAAAANAARIAEMERQACLQSIKGYQNDTATPAEARAYALCVGRVYPAPVSSGDVLVIKGAIVLVFIGIALGIWQAKREWGTNWVDYCMYAVGGAVALPLAAAILVGLMAGVAYLFSA